MYTEIYIMLHHACNHEALKDSLPAKWYVSTQIQLHLYQTAFLNDVDELWLLNTSVL